MRQPAMARATRLWAPLLVLTVAGFLGAAAPVADINGGRDITLPAVERAVKVSFFQAPGDQPRPSVLLLHGAGGWGRRTNDYKRYAAEIASQGIDAYLVNYYSDSDQYLLSFGVVSTFCDRYPDWVNLVADLADYLVVQTTSNGKLALIGFSDGGALTTGVSTIDPNISAAVVYYGTDPWPLAEKPTRYPPLLILHGDADKVIPVGEGKKLAEEAKGVGASVDLVIYPGQSHGFGADWTKKDATDAFGRTLAFLKKELDVK